MKGTKRLFASVDVELKAPDVLTNFNFQNDKLKKYNEQNIVIKSRTV